MKRIFAVAALVAAMGSCQKGDAVKSSRGESVTSRDSGDVKKPVTMNFSTQLGRSKAGFGLQAVLSVFKVKFKVLDSVGNTVASGDDVAVDANGKASFQFTTGATTGLRFVIESVILKEGDTALDRSVAASAAYGSWSASSKVLFAAANNAKPKLVAYVVSQLKDMNSNNSVGEASIRFLETDNQSVSRIGCDAADLGGCGTISTVRRPPLTIDAAASTYNATTKVLSVAMKCTDASVEGQNSADDPQYSLCDSMYLFNGGGNDFPADILFTIKSGSFDPVSDIALMSCAKTGAASPWNHVQDLNPSAAVTVKSGANCDVDGFSYTTVVTIPFYDANAKTSSFKLNVANVDPGQVLSIVGVTVPFENTVDLNNIAPYIGSVTAPQ